MKKHSIASVLGITAVLAASQCLTAVSADAVHTPYDVIIDTVTISSSTVVPAALAEGNSVIVRGTLKSGGSAITGVNAGVFDTNGYRVTGKTVYPNTYSYDLNQLDEYVLFDKLEAGTYYYKVFASNASSAGSILVDQKFTVKAASSVSDEKSAALIGGVSVPKSLTQGKGVTVKGQVESDSPLHALTLGIYSSSGKAVYEKRIYPSAKTYDLNQLDSHILFSDLKPGTYSYQVIAANDDSDNHVLTKQNFTVVSGSSKNTKAVSSDDAKSAVLSGGTAIPSKLAEGHGVVVKGIVKSSDSKITALTVGVFNQSGKRVTGKTVYPGTSSYDLNKLDEYILFSDLKPGTYSYQVIAANEDSDNHILTKQSFTVKKAASSAVSSSSSSDNTSTSSAGGGAVTLSGAASIPGRISSGDAVTVSGILKSNSKIYAVTAAVYDADGNRVTGKTVYPGTASYDLSRLDSYVNFHKLEKGLYSYQVIASNADSDNHVLVNKSFRVVE